MMSKKQWFALFCLYIIFLLLGATIFFYIESREEARKIRLEVHNREIIEDMLRNHYKGTNDSVEDVFTKLTDYCGKPIHYNMSADIEDNKWNFYNAMFFVITVVSTIGYGNLAPTTMFTRIFMIFYGLVGIPINGIVMVTLGEFFAKSFKKLYARWKNTRIEKSSAKFGLIGQIILYSVPGLTFFIFVPSTLISLFEGWDYDVSVYYTFVTLTTIGFGDFVAGQNNLHKFESLYFMLYKIFLLAWIIGGIGYIVMILGFITQGMRHKKVVEIEKMLEASIRKTPTKIRDELRSILQEFLFLRVKPVYKGEFEYTPHVLERRQSCPDLSLWRNLDSPTMLRKRAMSECYKHVILERIKSETDLEMIDKDLTFKPSQAFMQQKDLILKVVDALSSTSAEPGPSDGYHCFSDNEILASERIGSQKRRTLSDAKLPVKNLPYLNGHTWYGEDAGKAIKEFNKCRIRTLSSPSLIRDDERPNLFQRIKNRFWNKEDKNADDIEKQATQNLTKKRTSVYLDLENALRRSSTTQEQVLEQTSIADFIRALSAITVPEANCNSQPRRKMGTATPPDSANGVSRRRRIPIRAVRERRGSLMQQTSQVPETRRRFSLMALEENLLSPPPYSALPPEARTSFRAPRTRRFSVRPSFGNLSNTMEKQDTKESDI